MNHKNFFLTGHKYQNQKVQNLSIFYTQKNIRKQYNKLEIIPPTCNDEFELQDSSYSVSDIQDYIKYIIELELELQMPETIKLFGSTKKLIDKTKNGEKVLIHAVVEVALI